MEFLKKLVGKDDHPVLTAPVFTEDGKIWLDVLLHVENVGDVKSQHGTHLISHPSRRIEGIQINTKIPDVEILYMAHLESQGDSHWKKNGEFVGSRGKSKRLEGIAVKLEGSGASQYDVKYYVQMQGVAESPVVSNGAFAGTRGQAKRVEGIAIWVEPKQAGGSNAQAPQMIPYDHVVDELDIDKQYATRANSPSDINEHLPTLYRYAKGCTQIAEFGVREVVSTWAFLKGLRDTDAPDKKLICVDLQKSENIRAAERAAANNNIKLEFIEGNDLAVSLQGGVDFLFIDTWHVYPQLKLELDIHSPNVRKYIAMHDTEVDGETGESVRCGFNVAAQSKESGFSEADIRTGLKKAVKEFLETHPEWRSREVFTNNNGLTVLERVSPSS